LLNTMVDDFAIVVHADWMMWLVAAIWILVPRLLLVTTALSVFIVLLVGTKLELVGVMLSQQAYLSRSYQGEGSIKTQPISAPNSLLKKPLEMISNRLGRSSETRRAENRRPQLATQSMSVYTHRDSEIPLSVVRRAHSFEEKDHSSMDVPPPVSRQQGVRFDVKSEPEKDEISPVAEDATQISEHVESRAGTLLKSTSWNSKLPDSATFFWFGRPRLILRALQFVYFETSMAIALVFFDLWQSSDFILEDTALLGNDYLLVVILIVVGVLCLLQTSFLMLPTYVLTSVAGSHCPEKVLAQAKKLNIKEAEVSKIEYLRNKSVLSRLDTLNKMPTHDHSHHGRTDNEHGEANAATAVLVGAMYKGKVERMQKQEARTFSPSSSSHGAAQNPLFHTVIDVDEEDEELQAIVEAFGSFGGFLASIKTSQDLIKQKCPEAVFNFDCYAGSYHEHQSTSFDAAAINLTLDLNAAVDSLDKQTQ